MPSTDTRTSEAVEFLKGLVRFPSLSGEEGPIADFVEAHVQAAGVATERLDDNVYFSLGDGPDGLLLNSHLDVVPASQDHPYDPFDPVVKDGCLYGRGSVDAKASGAAMTTALLQLARAGWTPPGGRVLVALTTCEETGDAYNGLEVLRPHLPPVRAAIVGEPTQLRPCVAQKGLLILIARAHGRTAHAARAHRGENAILMAARDLRRLQDLSFLDDDPFLGRPTLTVTTIDGGSARNVVPDTCTFTIDARTTPSFPHEKIIERLSDLLESEITIHSDRIVPVSTPLSARIVKACREVLPEVDPFGSPTASDWIFLSDVPTVKLGPGASRFSHTPVEHIAIDEVTRAAGVYQAIIRSYFENA